MDFEERQKQRRRRFWKVLVAEVGMVVSVILIVVVASLAAMGFFVTSNGRIEQTGLIQIHSMPTGASVTLDGGTLFSRTNLSKSLTPGEHYIQITRDGYDSWSKNIRMSSGMLVRLYYPRLFLQNRTPEEVMAIGSDLEFYSVSRDFAYILYAEKGSAKWELVNIKNEEARRTEIDLAKVLPGVNKDGFSGRILGLTWNGDSNKILTKVEAKNEQGETLVEWILIDLNDQSRSLNLTKTFGLEFEQIEIMDEAASQLLALENGRLRRINTNEQAISRVILEGVKSFASSGTNVVYVLKDEVGVYRDGDRGGSKLLTLNEGEQAKVAIAKYYDELHLVVVRNENMSVYSGALPAYNENAEAVDFSGLKVLIDNVKLGMVPERLTVSPDEAYFIAEKGRDFAVIDLEMAEVTEYQTDVAGIRWLDDSMMNMVINGDLKAWDFDNTNQRTLVEGRKDLVLANYPAAISSNNKWMYYVVKTKVGLMLEREKIRD